MLTVLNGRKRWTAGRLLALVYLFCVLAPAMSFAFSDGTRTAPCLTENEHGVGIVHVHEQSGNPVPAHVHAASSTHDHSVGHSHDAAALQVAPDYDTAASVTTTADSSSPRDHHKSSGGQCCGMVCVSALPAQLTDFARPAAPRSICPSIDYRAVADNSPPQRYRPPIV